ncbi:Anaphase-promoting complex subunit 4 [Phytophthora cinnamomi]|uniref:Anaphase-promoting complex subunit 4 n=1 Tax=Phytophthora cinnamomi TaxID=4785 RepID=UPI00355A7387|nr:Anaphase-promoting complex subunit 4 [Phytophthora cinnamomi]
MPPPKRAFVALQDRFVSSLVVACCPTMDLIAVITLDHHLLVHRTTSWQKLLHIKPSDVGLEMVALAWKPDGLHLAVGSPALTQYFAQDIQEMSVHRMQKALFSGCDTLRTIVDDRMKRDLVDLIFLLSELRGRAKWNPQAYADTLGLTDTALDDLVTIAQAALLEVESLTLALHETRQDFSLFFQWILERIRVHTNSRDASGGNAQQERALVDVKSVTCRGFDFYGDKLSGRNEQLALVLDREIGDNVHQEWLYLQAYDDVEFSIPTASSDIKAIIQHGPTHIFRLDEIRGRAVTAPAKSKRTATSVIATASRGVLCVILPPSRLSIFDAEDSEDEDGESDDGQ